MMSSTGYKVRTYLAKSLQRRCKAIRNAVAEYNAAAVALDPPRPEIDWSEVSHYSFVEEFALLQDTRNDIREKQWSHPQVREYMRLGRRIEHAHEEILNANRELRRLHTWIRDEELLFQRELRRLREEKNILYPAILDYCRRRRAANARNMAYIQATHDLPGFSGNRTPGRRVGAMPASETAPSTENASHEEPVPPDASDVADLALDEDADGEVTSIIHYLADLTT